MMNHTSLFRIQLNQGMTFFTQTTFRRRLKVWNKIRKKSFSLDSYFAKRNDWTIFRESGLAINRFVFRDECLDPYLLFFIKIYHRNDQYVFWPDKASAHYAKEVIDWLNSNKIEFVPKYLNPANAPKTRSIKDC